MFDGNDVMPAVPPPGERATERRRWVAPAVTTVRPEERPVLLCTSGQPFVCEGGGCCDVASSCDYYCNGG